MPTASMKTIDHSQWCTIRVPTDVFLVDYGYKDRSSVQVRLQPDGQVYLSDDNEAVYPDKIISATVPFELFAREWRQFVRHMAAVLHQDGKGCSSADEGGDGAFACRAE